MMTRAYNQAVLDQLSQPFRDLVRTLIEQRVAGLPVGDQAAALRDLLGDLRQLLQSDPPHPIVRDLAVLKMLELFHEYHEMLVADVDGDAWSSPEGS